MTPHTASPTVQQNVLPSAQYTDLIALLRARPSDPSAPIDELRSGYEKFARAMRAPAAGVTVQPDTIGSIPAEIHQPENGSAGNAVLYFHGGGYGIGSLETHRSLCSALAARSDMAVVAVDYRLAPEHPFPAAYEDALAAYTDLADSDLASRHLAVAGDSAGGGLALATMLGAVRQGLRRADCGVLISPMTDLSVSGRSYQTRESVDPIVSPQVARRYAAAYLAEADPRDHRASPLFADLTGLPPVHIQVGSDEVLLDDSLMLARRLRDAGSPVDLDVWPHGAHVLPFFHGQIPEAQQALESIGGYLRGQWRPRAGSVT